ncbi:uncharacterized protein LOC116014112 isoform X1 [Ipomoea triloba]|uniref:uncharacterized protein LOC116014112 isoform X1 n=1 Tax=Ipomoea triloba TaxID=35885 RepID=UPI00125E6BD3|nr:uncharacterized protein LOC116014112 isoform X1 [Ipomoea triloba]
MKLGRLESVLLLKSQQVYVYPFAEIKEQSRWYDLIAPHIQISGIYTLAPCFIAVYTEKFKNGAGLLTFICFTSTDFYCLSVSQMSTTQLHKMQVAMPSESVLYDCRTLSSMHLLLLTSFTLCSKKNSFALGKPSGVRASLNLQISVFRFISKRFTHSAILSR